MKFFTFWWKRRASGFANKLRATKSRLFSFPIPVGGQVVELGPGTGVNFEFLPKRSNYTWKGVEPNREMWTSIFRQPSYEFGPKKVLTHDIHSLGKGHADYVISSLVLCSVPNLDEELLKVKEVLKEGGEFLCVEHVGAPKGTLVRSIQKLIKPLTRLLGGGCEPDRDIKEAIARHFEILECREDKIFAFPFPLCIIACRAKKS